MTPERWQRVKEILDAALERAPGQRQDFLVAACAGDPGLKAEVESLVASDDRAAGFLESHPGIAPPLPPALPAGTRVGPYRLLREIAQGGMGAVHLAERADDQYKKQVAIKFLRTDGGDQSMARRFRQERQILADLDHPNVARLLEGGTTGEGVPYIVMEYVEGTPIDEYCEGRGLSVQGRLGLIRTVSSAVAYAHRMQVVHRDLKPSNILVTADGTPKLLDFGIAKLLAPPERSGPIDATTIGLRPMTPEYASPEQVRGEPITTATDLYALGVLMYRLLVGRGPYRLTGRSQHELARAICEQEAEAPSRAAAREGRRHVPRDVDAIVLKALRKEADQRYTSVEDLAEDIRRHQDGHPVTARRGAVAYRTGKFVRRNGAALAAGFGMLAVGSVLMALLSPIAGRPSASQAAAGSPRSVAVLPLANLSGDPGQEYLADGLTEALISDLSKVGSLRVISRTSVMRYKDARKPLAEIARELGVQTVLEGSVQRSTDRVRINVQLIDATTDRHVWSERYERAFRDVLSLQTEIAAAVSREVRVVLTPAEKARLGRARPVNPWAHELYLKGLYFMNKENPEALQTALGHFEEAIQADPGYALAYAGLAQAYCLLGTTPQGALPSREALTKAREAVLKALELDHELSDAHATLGVVRFRLEWDWRAAEREYQRAIELNPSGGRTHGLYAIFLSAMGRHEEALAEADRGVALDPMSPTTQWYKVIPLGVARRFDEALAQNDRVLALDPTYVEAFRVIGEFHAEEGRVREAVEAFQRAGIATRPFVLAYLGIAHARAGQRKEAQAVLAQLQSMSATRYVPAVAMAIAHMAVGDHDAAFEWLDRAHFERSSFMIWLKSHRVFDPLRADPRFDALVRRVGFPRDPPAMSPRVGLRGTSATS